MKKIVFLGDSITDAFHKMNVDEEKLGNVLGMLGANVADEDIYHGEDQHPKMSM